MLLSYQHVAVDKDLLLANAHVISTCNFQSSVTLLCLPQLYKTVVYAIHSCTLKVIFTTFLHIFFYFHKG